ncbi:LexA repressor [Gracilibacillus halophilus YIM-C55.5]|uniref:DNA 3'-5' helicase n=1 Tax=Gracilibacillus halophilus YIM-C55.5 TaxID=1308866 RepID=N4WTD2_9BACI|nr:transcriptional repressor LexA [Gracilibacillus halophilus]ENH97580.1 LexA repressor [Gracilibacillus halophilus YIM-C55.5]
MKLNVEQRKIVELEPNGHMLIKGVAGSGKTTVAIRRISFLQMHYCMEDDDNILLVTFNKTLLNYIHYQYKKLEDEEKGDIEAWLSGDSDVVIKTIDKLMFSYFMRYLKRHQLKRQIADQQTLYKTIQQAIMQLKEEYADIKILSPKYSSFLLDEIAWIKSCGIPDEVSYQQIDRIGRSTGGRNTPQKLTKNSKTRQAIYQLKERYDELLEAKGLVDFKTMNLLALQQAQEVDQSSYTHIIIDESQDLTKVQLHFLKTIHDEKSYGSITFVADNTQSIYSHSWLGKGRPYTTIGYDMSGKARVLTKNYRTTTEISKAAYGLIEHDEDIMGNVDFVKPSLIDRHGHAPIYRFFLTNNEQIQFFKQEIDQLRQEYRLEDICIVAKEKRLIEDIAMNLENEGIPTEILHQKQPDFGKEAVNLVTMHSIKGLEFKAIFLAHLDDGVLPNMAQVDVEDEETVNTEERKLLYVGMTRANELLYMSSVKKPSKFLKEINPNQLRFKRDASLRPFQKIAISNYQFSEQLLDVNAKEEIIRQWMIYQLIHTYQYPKDVLSIEYGVQQFSKRGYVDIAVMIHVDGEQIPYIFVETKSFGNGVTSATEQLKSYMSTSDHVRYGIATDGLDISIIDRNGEPINDIPKCQPHFLPETKYKSTYTDLRKNKEYDYLQDKDDLQTVEIIDQTTGLAKEMDQPIQVPIIGDVAAGLPMSAIEDYRDTLPVPEDWLIQAQDTFVLQVTGDSMIDDGIEPGDFVLVHRQQTATNGDIVIAVIDGEATIKKYMPMGNTILLVPANTNYEPIQMNADDVFINGKVIGVMHRNHM